MTDAQMEVEDEEDEEVKRSELPSTLSAPDLQSAIIQHKKAAARPQVTVYNLNGKATKKLLPMPDVMLAPVRADIVNFVHTNMAKNNRQPYGVQNREGPKGIRAGMQVAAKSWGTGRAVSRIPRVKGGGTHRAGQGAYANLCRGGRMFSPTKVWRKWHRKINTNQKRYAVCSAVAASAVPALVMARGHRIQTVQEVPLVIENSFENVQKTRAALSILQALQLGSELRRCKRRYMRAGRGKSRNRRWKHRVGPLIIYKRNAGIVKAARNIRGIDFCNVYSLNLLKLAPGGHVGRLVIWTEGAFRALDDIYGTNTRKSICKSNYQLPRPLMTNSDLNRIINSEEVQSVIMAKKVKQTIPRKRNPLKHPELYAELNPLFDTQWKELKDAYPENAKPRTTRVLKPIKKAQRVKIALTKEEKLQMRGYWKNVFGDAQETTFKSRVQLAAEREAVLAAMAAADREKKGLDLLDALEAKELAAERKDDDSDDESS